MGTKAKRPFAAGALITTCDNGTVESLPRAASSDPKLPPGTNRCLCSACGRYFGGADGYTRHRVNFQCVNPAILGMALNRGGYWVRAYRKGAPIEAARSVGDDISTYPLEGYSPALNCDFPPGAPGEGRP